MHAAAEGRRAKDRYEASNTEIDPEFFTSADHATLSGAWGSWLDEVVGPAVEAGPGGLIGDDPARITAPTLLLHGGHELAQGARRPELGPSRPGGAPFPSDPGGYSPRTAWAAARRAPGTLKGEHET